MDIEKKVEAIEERVSDNSLAYDILQELKQNTKRWFIAFITILCLWAITIVGFLWYQSLWDYETTTTYEANGLYAFVDSNGNILAQDVTEEQLEAFKEWWEVNGNSKADNIQNP